MDLNDWNFNMKIKAYSNELQIQINDVYSCPGHCPGCSLSTLERKSNNSDMQPITLVNAIEKLKSYVKNFDNLEKINITYGIADHFLMTNEYLENTFHLAADLIKDANLVDPHNGVFYSVSMIGKHEKIMDKVRFLHSLSKERNVPVYFVAVLDPKNLYHQTFSKTYSQNIIKTNELIGILDLSINLSEEAISFLSPQQLFEFSLKNNFDKVNINWTPTSDNLEFSYMDNEKLAQWLIDFDKLVATTDMEISYRPSMMKIINSIRCQSFSLENDFQQTLNNYIQEIMYKTFQIDEHGNIFTHFEGIGDIAHSPRLGFKPLGNVNDNKSILNMITEHMNHTKKIITKEFVMEPCTSCDYNIYCSNTGFHIYNNILRNAVKTRPEFKVKVQSNIDKYGCPHIAKKMFSYYEKICESEDKK